MKKTMNKVLSVFLSLILSFGVCFVIESTDLDVYASNYNIQAAINYAKTYWSDYNPNYHNYNEEGGDCANFVSQCLYAGGLQQDSTWKKDSPAWIGCVNLVSYLKSKGYRFIDYASASDIKLGNPVFYWDGNKNRWAHVSICTGFNGNEPLVTAHNNNHCDVNWELGGSKYWGGSNRKATFILNGSVPNFPGSEDTSYAVPVRLNANRKDNTYDDFGNMESNHWIDAGDSCYIEKVYTNGFCRVQYPSGSEQRWAYAKANVFTIPKKNSGFPGSEDTSYAVPAQVNAVKKDNTYDDNGNVESGHWIDAGDSCYVEKVYTNGFCRVRYPAGSEQRWAYAKASIFSIPKKNSGFPGSEDTSYAVPAQVNAVKKDNTYDDNGNVESGHWIDAGDSCYVEKVYTNGFCRVRYPAGSEQRWAYAKASIFSVPKKNSGFPGAEDTSYAVPVWQTAKYHDNTYDGNGNMESNRWIDAGDNCYIDKVYQNGFCHVQYPAGSVQRWAYAKSSLFDLPKTHNYTTTVVAPTCTAQGYTLHKCSHCGDSYKDNYQSALGHNYQLSSQKRLPVRQTARKFIDAADAALPRRKQSTLPVIVTQQR